MASFGSEYNIDLEVATNSMTKRLPLVRKKLGL